MFNKNADKILKGKIHVVNISNDNGLAAQKLFAKKYMWSLEEM